MRVAPTRVRGLSSILPARRIPRPDRLLPRVPDDFGRPPVPPYLSAAPGRLTGGAPTARGRWPSGAGCRVQGGRARHEGTSAVSAVNDVRYRLEHEGGARVRWLTFL